MSHNLSHIWASKVSNTHPKCRCINLQIGLNVSILFVGIIKLDGTVDVKCNNIFPNKTMNGCFVYVLRYFLMDVLAYRIVCLAQLR